MTDKEFCYWLQGFVELGGEAPTKEQWASIKEHLALVFTKVTNPVITQPVPSNPYLPVPSPQAPFDTKKWDFEPYVAIC